MEILSARNLSFSYSGKSGRKVLSSLDLSVEKGEFLTILGPNGSGKSTLGKLLGGLLQPTEGEVLLNGISTSGKDNRNAVRKTIGIVFQNPDNQIVGDTVEEDVAFGPENLGLPQDEIRSRVDEALSLVDALGLKGRSPQKLSGGQKQRVAIAGILALRPEVVILDESTSMLDPKGRKEVLESILKLRKERGMTILLITHHSEECLLSDRTIVVADGVIRESGRPEEVLGNYSLLKSLGLEIPYPLELSVRLREKGLEDFPLCLTVEELASSVKEGMDA